MLHEDAAPLTVFGPSVPLKLTIHFPSEVQGAQSSVYSGPYEAMPENAPRIFFLNLVAHHMRKTLRVKQGLHTISHGDGTGLARGRTEPAGFWFRATGALSLALSQCGDDSKKEQQVREERSWNFAIGCGMDTYLRIGPDLRKE